MPSINITYTVDPAPGNIRPADLVSKLVGVDIFLGELQMLGMHLISDIGVIVAGMAVRDITLETTPDGDVRFPTNEALIYATKNLYTQSLALGLPGPIVASDPVVL